jgi:hypothetical protein
MSVFFRKSVKFGPVRFNFSKSGIGTSFGVKGLRVGVSSKGKKYISGGSHGIYFRENLNKSSTRNRGKEQRSNYSSIPMTHNEKLANFYVLFVAIFIVSFFFPLLFIVSIPWASYIISKITSRYKMMKFKKEFNSSFDEFLENKKYDQINDLISKIPVYIKDEAEKTAFVLDIYTKTVFSFIDDNDIDESETKILETIISIASPEVLSTVNETIINEILKRSISDNRITKNEEDLINKCITLFKLSNIKDKIIQVINDYKQLEKIETYELPRIKPSLNINDNNDFYYENNCKYKKVKTEKGIQTIIDDCDGIIIISAKNIHFIADGHKTIKIASIISADLVETNIEMIVNNRKTPYYFSVNNPITFLGIIKKLL